MVPTRKYWLVWQRMTLEIWVDGRGWVQVQLLIQTRRIVDLETGFEHTARRLTGSGEEKSDCRSRS